jgi:hypothetical protein
MVNDLIALDLSRTLRDLTVAGWSGLNSFDWSVDGKGFFTGNTTGSRSTLLFVDLNGKAQRPAFGRSWAGVQWQHVDDREFLNRRNPAKRKAPARTSLPPGKTLTPTSPS